MKATGMVRRIDDLGRVVIPKEIRRTLRIKEGDPLEIFVDRGEKIILQRYSPIGELSEFAKECVEALYETVNKPSLVTDRDNVVAVAGASDKEFSKRPLSSGIEEVLSSGKAQIIDDTEKHSFYIDADEYMGSRFKSEIIVPIMSNGDAIGTVVIGSKEKENFGELEMKIAETCAKFLAKQIG